mmetsp:Transcript_5076/g.16788  ORF Transcript_5076/g.16788 Transcript_5076/m.16788 type:complete len:329 (-) Transcript_5076:786-1772(-)
MPVHILTSAPVSAVQMPTPRPRSVSATVLPVDGSHWRKVHGACGSGLRSTHRPSSAEKTSSCESALTIASCCISGDQAWCNGSSRRWRAPSSGVTCSSTCGEPTDSGLAGDAAPWPDGFTRTSSVSTTGRRGKGTRESSPSDRATMTAGSSGCAAASTAISRTFRGIGARSTTTAAARATGSHTSTCTLRAIAMWPEGSGTAPITPASHTRSSSSVMASSILSQRISRTNPLEVSTSITSPSSQMAAWIDPTDGEGCASPTGVSSEPLLPWSITAYRHRCRKTEDPANAASSCPLLEKSSCWKPPVASALAGRCSLVAVWSHDAFCSG